MEEQKRVSNTKYAFAAFLSVIVFVITYKYVLNQLAEYINDLVEHTWHAENIYLDSVERIWNIWLQRPYLFWHLCVKCFIKFGGMPVKEAAACTCSCFAVFCYFVTFFIIDRLTERSKGKNTGIASAGAAGILSFVTALYMWWYNIYQHEGQFSINPFFNPTHMAVKPFGLLTFIFAVDIILRYKGREPVFCRGKRTQKFLYVLFGGALFMSTFTKPTFMYMLLPAGVVYVLIDWIIALVKKDGSGKKIWGTMWRLACACIPSLIYLGLEYAAFYFWGGTNEDAKVAIYPFLTAWHVYSPNVPKSILLAMSFPIWMLIMDWKYFLHSVEGRLSVIGYVVGALEFSFFVETGFKLTHLNFSWPMMSGMLLFWVIAASRLVERTCDTSHSGFRTVEVTVGWFLLTLHLFSGLYYISPGHFII